MDSTRLDDISEFERRGLKRQEPTGAAYAVKQLPNDARAVASTPEGRRLLHWMISNVKTATVGCLGDRRDYYNLGRREAAEALDGTLRLILPRDTYIEIIYPQQEETNERQ
ncbi:MAG: hypothetical protein LUC93_03300 [Planctomycetaceae bacterium]|nr:hypothetical protein [Planctomycetaceae bacterium]